ncbi:MAG: prepilin-type N-terminal cleavage/methylation domain-containing protein [Clostridia bacterium]|nr:prepilin-type N-terminal cleavage/methylation domain-containing protein [Clostridia bacterium]
MKKTNKKGFTLAELLIVVAIIAVLVAIAIPIFTAQLEKAREAVDEANIRDAYAVCVASSLTESVSADVKKNETDKIKYEVTGSGATYKVVATITATQTEAGWKSGEENVSVGGVAVAPSTTGWTITVDNSTGAAPVIAVKS